MRFQIRKTDFYDKYLRVIYILHCDTFLRQTIHALLEEKMQTATAKILVLSAALATTAAFAAAKLQTKFNDIPAGHWATVAVEAIAADGLITGYPDGTFQGTRNLTRYEAATIFYRLLQSGKLQAMPATTQTTVQQGIAEVGPELTALTTRVGVLETSNDTRLKALEEQLANLTSAPVTEATTEASAALEDRIVAIEEEITMLRDAASASTVTTPATTTPDPAVETRITALETELAALKTAAAAPATPASTTALEARLKALEDKVAAAPATPIAAPAASIEITNRLTALEVKVAALPIVAAPADTSALTATVAAQDARIVTLESALTKLQADVEGLKTTATTTITTTPITTGSSVTTTVTPAPSSSSTRFSIGLGGSANISGPVGAGASPFGLYAQLGLSNLVGPIGLRAFVDLSSVPTAGAQLTLNLGDGGFEPYIGLGGGVIFGGATNFFVAGSLGANLGLGGGLGVFAEINPRYNLSASQFSIKAAFGVRFTL